MPLIQCHECSGQISDHARTCPHCGAPVIATIKRKQKAFLIELGVRVGVAIIVGVSLWIVFHRIMNSFLQQLKAPPPPQQQSH